MSVPFWRADDSGWDDLYFDDFLWPGIAKLKIDKGRAVQVDKSKEEDGNTLSDNGYEGAKISGAIKLNGPDDDVAADLLTLELGLRRFDPASSNGVAKPVVLTHPQATLHNVKNIYALKWGSTTPDGDDFIVTFEATEWFPAPKPVKKGGGSSDSKSSLLDPFREAASAAADAAEQAAGQLFPDVPQSNAEPNYDVPSPDPVGKGATQP
jgi:hypothetical protein